MVLQKQDSDDAKKLDALVEDGKDDVIEESAWFTYDKSWENIQEDADGNLVLSTKKQQRRKRKLVLETVQNVERGLLRFLYIIIDQSRSTEMNDFKPQRKVFVEHLLEVFLREFFQENPLSQVGLIIGHNGIADKISSLGGNPQLQIEKLQADREFVDKGGSFSLQNTLEVARTGLVSIPRYGSKEILVIMSSMSTTDPGDLMKTIQSIKNAKMKVDIIGLGAELYICRTLAKRTGGSYHIPTDENHFKELLMSHIPPKPLSKSQKVERHWVHMGFPMKRTAPYPTLCGCHKLFRYTGYKCPRCTTLCCDLPTACKTCGLTLISSPHLAKSYHHLFPVPMYVEMEVANTTIKCFGCFELVDPDTALLLKCPKCENQFCSDCDLFAHNVLRVCPGCLSSKKL